GLVYVGSQTSTDSNAGKLDVFNANGCGKPVCAPKWQGDAGPQSILQSSPAVVGGRVYVGSFDGKLYVFKAKGCGAKLCQPLWPGSHQTDFVNGSPAVYKGKVYIGLEFDVGVFDAAGCGHASCGPLWLDFGTGTQADILSSPTIANGVLYAGKMNGQVLAWKAVSCGQFVCNEIWSYLTHDPIVNSSPTVVNGTVYIGGANNLAPEGSAGRLHGFAL